MDWTWLPTVTLHTFWTFPSAAHTHKHTQFPERSPAVNWKRGVCHIRLSSLPGDGSHPPGSRGVCPISPSTPHASTQGWRDQPWLYARAIFTLVCVCVQKCFHVPSVSLSSRCVCTHEGFVCRLKVREVNFRLPTQDIVSQFNHDSTSWCAAAAWLNALVLMAAVHLLCRSPSYTHTRAHTHIQTQYSPFDLEMCVFGCNFFPVSCSFSEPNLKAAAFPWREEWISLGLLWY